MRFLSNKTDISKWRLSEKIKSYYFSFWDIIIKIIAGNFIGWLSRRENFGGARFKIIRFIYKHLPYYSKARNEIWEWVLNYIPSLSMTFFRGLSVMDVGCTDSLLLYEFANRGYGVLGVDVRDYQAKLPKHILFLKHDITDPKILDKIRIKFNYIVCISIIELVGVDMYRDIKDQQGDRKALEILHKLIADNGYLLLSVTIENFRCLKGRGYSMKSFLELINGLFFAVEITQRCGHICAVLVKQ